MPSAIATVSHRTADPTRDLLPVCDRRAWLVAIPLALSVIYAFFPALANGFVAWDDDQNFVDNPYFRGLGAAQVKWAWTTSWLGVYQPLAWLLFEAQYVVCQLEPRGFHVMSLLLHVANSIVLYVLTVALLVRCDSARCRENPWICSLSAGLATALFAVHPLRVEVVAWASCQPYLPCALFSMLSVLAYLRAFWNASSPRWIWLVGSYFLFVAALLFHPVPVNLPAVLLILDAYPLRRFWDTTGRWLGPSVRRALLEKVPLLITSLGFMAIAITVRAQSPFRVEPYDASEGIAQACYAIWFYIQKTVFPLDLAAVYPLPKELNWRSLPYSLSILATLATSAFLILTRRRWPGPLAAWLSYLLILAPNSGIIRNNSFMIAADRYSYTAMLGPAILVAACFWRLSRMSSWAHPGTRIGIVTIGIGVVIGLTAATRNQCRIWLDAEILWTHALSHGADSSDLGHYNLGVALEAQRNYRAARDQYVRALRLNPGHSDAHNNLGVVFDRLGKYEPAVVHYTEALRLNPGHAGAHNNLGAILSRHGNYEEARAHYAEALRLQPVNADAHFNLATALFRRGKYPEAEAHFTEAVRLNPSDADAHNNLGVVLDKLGKYQAAVGHLIEAVRLKPGSAEAYNAGAMIMAACPEARFRDGERAVKFATRACELTKGKDPRFLNTLAAAYAETGDFPAAIKSQKRAIGLLSEERQKDDYRARLRLYEARTPYRREAPARGVSQ